MIGAVFLLVVAGLIFWKVESDRRRRAQDALIRSTIRQHADALALKRRILIQPDVYGQPDRRKWEREVRYFLDNVLCHPRFNAAGIHLGEGAHRRIATWRADIAEVTRWIEEIVLEHEESNPNTPSQIVDEATPSGFERQCAQRLESLGWRARLTGGTGDQGADVIAEKGTCRVVIQCKRYSGSVGNSAVQEAHAARSYFEASAAAVVTTSSFTASATALAAKLGVRLLRDHEIWRLEELAGTSGTPAASKAAKTYTLVGADGAAYRSALKGTLGGHRGTKRYGRLDCPAALRAIAKGGYVDQRVFFANELDARAAGYQPCGTCCPDAYRAWKENA